MFYFVATLPHHIYIHTVHLDVTFKLLER